MTVEGQELTMTAAINAVRVGRGLPALLPAGELGAAARRQAADLAASPQIILSGDFHTGSDGSTIGQRARDAGYDPLEAREVVGWGFEGEVQPMVNWWLASPSHVGIVLDAGMRDVGVGYVYAPGSMWSHYWCVVFGRQPDGSAAG